MQTVHTIFLVVAHNNEGDTLSNCRSVTVSKQEAHPGIPGYDILFTGGVLGIAIVLIIKKKHKKLYF